MGKTTHFGKPFHEYDPTSGSDPAYGPKPKPKPGKPPRTKVVKTKPKPRKDDVIKPSGKKKIKVPEKGGGMIGDAARAIEDRQKDNADRINRIFKKGGD